LADGGWRGETHTKSNVKISFVQRVKCGAHPDVRFGTVEVGYNKKGKGELNEVWL